MKKNKKFLVLAIAAALSAASAGSALALENQFNGAFTTFFDMGNFASSGAVQDDAPTANYFVQRVRLGYTAKADDHVKLVTKFEFDYNFWGNSSYNVGRGQGGAIGADSVNMETKHLYLDLNYPAVNAKIGMMPYNDSFKGLLFDGDMAGILLSHDYSKAGISAGFFRFGDATDDSDALEAGRQQDYTRLGKNTSDMFSLDGKYNVSKDLSVGAGYYYIKDDSRNSFLEARQDSKVHSLGINAAGNVGPIALNGLFLQQFGDLAAGVDAEGYAFNVGAKMPLAGGTLRSEFLYVSGGNDAFYVANGPGFTEGGQFYDAEMIMLGRDKYATSIDNAIIYDVNNGGEGVIMGTVGYDYTFNDKVSGSANVGFAAVADNVGSARNTGGADNDYLGTEVNAEAYYKLSANVTLGARAGYVFLGDYFASSNDDPYDMKLIAKYNF